MGVGRYGCYPLFVRARHVQRCVKKCPHFECVNTQICSRFECRDEHTIHTCVYCVLTLNAGTGRRVCVCVHVLFLKFKFKIIRNHKTMIQITKNTGKSIKNHKKAAQLQYYIYMHKETKYSKMRLQYK